MSALVLVPLHLHAQCFLRAVYKLVHNAVKKSLLLTESCSRCTHAVIPQVDAFKWMGVVMIAVALIGVGGQYFPMWGGMFFPARKGYTEEDFYFAEYSAAEREQGLHLASSAFVSTQLSIQTCLC